MAKTFNIEVDEHLKNKCDLFIKNIKSGMHYKADLDSNLNSLEWLEILEECFPYVDNIVRNPKVALITETEVQKIEKAKKIGVESVKDLAKHTNYIEKIEKNRDVRPSRILVLLREETFNTYENRFIYTLIHEVSRFVLEKEEMLKKLDSKNEKELEYSSSTENGEERLKIELRISAKETNNGEKGGNFRKQIEDTKRRIKRLRDYITLWERSELVRSLDKIHASFVVPPIKKTNMILKNPNFQMAVKLWDFILNYVKDESKKSKSLDTSGNETLRKMLDDSFLMDYFVLDSICRTRKDQREKLTQYAMIMIMEQVERAMEILLNNGIKVTEEQLLSLVSIEINNGRSRSELGSTDIKNKFKQEMDEYLKKVQDL